MDKESPLENGLVKFVEDHSETFTDVASIRRSIIRAFATFEFHRQYSGILRAGQQHYVPPGLKHLAIIILKAITGRIMSGNNFTSESIQNVLNNFDLCVEFIQTFVKKEPGLCTYEMRHNGLGGEVSAVQPCIEFMNSLVIPPRPLRVFVNMELNMNHAIWTNTKVEINLYHSRVLKLWAEILIGMNEIKNDVIEQMKQRMSVTTGSSKPMKIDAFGELVTMSAEEAAKAAIVSTFGNPANMNLKTLLNVLTFIHLTSYHDQMDLFSKNGDGLLVNRFVELNNTHSIGNSFIGPPISSKLNELQLKCNVIGNADSSLPVQAYLSSDLLDRCVKSIGGFPTTTQFVEFLNMVRQRKAEQFLKKESESDLSTVTTSSFGGGKKTIHKIKKRNKKSNKKRSQRSHYR
jgi:hypothetical protein